MGTIGILLIEREKFGIEFLIQRMIVDYFHHFKSAEITANYQLIKNQQSPFWKSVARVKLKSRFHLPLQITLASFSSASKLPPSSSSSHQPPQPRAPSPIIDSLADSSGDLLTMSPLSPRPQHRLGRAPSTKAVIRPSTYPLPLRSQISGLKILPRAPSGTGRPPLLSPDGRRGGREGRRILQHWIHNLQCIRSWEKTRLSTWLQLSPITAVCEMRSSIIDEHKAIKDKSRLGAGEMVGVEIIDEAVSKPDRRLKFNAHRSSWDFVFDLLRVSSQIYCLLRWLLLDACFKIDCFKKFQDFFINLFDPISSFRIGRWSGDGWRQISSVNYFVHIYEIFNKKFGWKVICKSLSKDFIIDHW